MQNKINGQKLREMLIYAGELVLKRQEEINALNVFPVPDGDTGSNMAMTIASGTKAILNSTSEEISVISSEYSKGLLMGARGNSGVILSQFFRGISIGLADKKDVSTEEFHNAIKEGYLKGYESVIKAVEGTILTVSRELYENKEEVEIDFIEYFEDLIRVGNISLNNTPNLLPILKEANVVDAGGFGLITILEAMAANLKGEEITIDKNFELYLNTEEHPMNPDDIEFGFCTEMLVNIGQDININDVREKLMTFGDSIVAVNDEDILKIHVHTEQPEQVLMYAQTLGRLIHMKSENMRIQAEEQQKQKQETMVECAIVAVASSEEMGSLFNEHTKVEIISGGQTLNPSVNDIINAINDTNASKVIILPNNSNIILAAQNAKNLITDKEILILETKYMTQAIEALNFYNPDLEIEQNFAQMQEAIQEINNFEITNAIKDTNINGVEIQKDDFMLINNGKITKSNAKVQNVLDTIADIAIEEESELVVICVGSEGKKKVVNKFVKKIEVEAPFTEVVIHYTSQDIYPYLVYLV